jgi:hypothetical protein
MRKILARRLCFGVEPQGPVIGEHCCTDMLGLKGCIA